ncbi:hypothetical protein [Streptosporangium carneum]|uniref:Uncharacterized protein n=1 Tax=Streptosporangium carneum TaxID=47481 RepID=A0A9W6HZ06_9ACTN|nr:hypothetical protein [Streptosporangium carneum]GLK08662.1 hypothetical protein GCM10017600_20670 [Streptosporangium carneum]
MTALLAHDFRAVDTAQRLCDVLTATHQLSCEVRGGYGLALVAMRCGLVVWCNGEWFWWCAGWDRQRRRPVYAFCRVDELEQAARRVAFHCARLREWQTQRRQAGEGASCS